LLLEHAPPGVAVGDEELQPDHELDIYDVERILDSRVSKKKIEYLVKWLDWDNIHNTWKPQAHLSCPKKVTDFYWQNPNWPKP
jgi:Chromo (CHRromatin Organisation MOdifier) domain